MLPTYLPYLGLHYSLPCVYMLYLFNVNAVWSTQVPTCRYLTLPVLGYLHTCTHRVGRLSFTCRDESATQREQNSHGSQSQYQSRDYKQNLLVRYSLQPTAYLQYSLTGTGRYLSFIARAFSLSLKKRPTQPNPAARTLRIKVGLYEVGIPSKNFKK